MRSTRGSLDAMAGRTLREVADTLRHVDESTSRECYVDPTALETGTQDRVLRLLGRGK